MVKEYYRFIKEYLEISNPRKDYLIITFITAFLYKVFLLLMPFLALWTIKYATYILEKQIKSHTIYHKPK